MITANEAISISEKVNEERRLQAANIVNTKTREIDSIIRKGAENGWIGVNIYISELDLPTHDSGISAHCLGVISSMLFDNGFQTKINWKEMYVEANWGDINIEHK